MRLSLWSTGGDSIVFVAVRCGDVIRHSYGSDAGLSCGRGYAAYAGESGDFLPPRAAICDNSRVVLYGVVAKRDGVAWHKGDTVCVLEPAYRPAARCVFSVPGQHYQVSHCAGGCPLLCTCCSLLACEYNMHCC
jgi:hypothetical protein